MTRPDGTPFRLTDLDGQPVSLADLRGKAVWVNFWASWCPPCQAETPVLRQVAATYKDRGLVVLGISVQESTASDVKAYVDKYRWATGRGRPLGRHPPPIPRVRPADAVLHRARRADRIDRPGPMDVDSATAQVEAILPPTLVARSAPAPDRSPRQNQVELEARVVVDLATPPHGCRDRRTARA